ncbi:MAG: RDD family protein [Pseudomonadota bacterium]
MGDEVQYAGFLRRLAAALIDALLLFVVLSPAGALFTQGVYFPDPDAGSGLQTLITFFGFDLTYLVINDLLPMALIIFFWLRFRATPGKQLMECEVVDASTHENLRIGQSLLRYIGYFISLLPLGLGFLWIIWDKKNRGFHDLLAHTVVLHVDPDHATDSISREPMEKLIRGVE